MLNHLSLVEMAELIQKREVSPVELIDAHFRQIEKHNPAINAFVVLLEKEAREAAKIAESSPSHGPLHGVPVTVKDSFDMQGLPTYCGSRFFQDRIAPQDSASARRFREAGAIILGKTNCPEFLMNYETDNFITGRTNSPWDLDRTPGGSSGGESAAIASFMSAGGIGSDGGGSIRVPAHFSGIAGLKPTPGRVPAAGHVPQISHPGGLLGVGGPMARSAADVRALFRVLAGHDSADPFSVPVPLREPQLKGLRIGVMPRFLDVPVQQPIKDAVLHAGRVLQSLGFEVDEFRPLGIDQAPDLWWFFFGQLSARTLQRLIGDRHSDAHFTGTELMKRALTEPEPTVESLLNALSQRDAMRTHMLAQMERYPVLLMPACGVTAFKHRERQWGPIGFYEAMAPATPWNLFGMPGMVIPWTQTPEGLPIGIQLVGQPWQEELLLDLAVNMEEARGPLAGPLGF